MIRIQIDIPERWTAEFNRLTDDEIIVLIRRSPLIGFIRWLTFHDLLRFAALGEARFEVLSIDTNAEACPECGEEYACPADGAV